MAIYLTNLPPKIDNFRQTLVVGTNTHNKFELFKTIIESDHINSKKFIVIDAEGDLSSYFSQNKNYSSIKIVSKKDILEDLNSIIYDFHNLHEQDKESFFITLTENFQKKLQARYLLPTEQRETINFYIHGIECFKKFDALINLIMETRGLNLKFMISVTQLFSIMSNPISDAIFGNFTNYVLCQPTSNDFTLLKSKFKDIPQNSINAGIFLKQIRNNTGWEEIVINT